MNETVKDLLLIIVIVVISLGICIGIDIKDTIDERLSSLECDVHNMKNTLQYAEETCDERFECSMDYWVSIEHKWY